MADVFSLTGSMGVTPASGAPSGIFSLIAQLSEQTTLVKKHQDEIELDVGTPVSVEFGGVVNANVVFLYSTGGKVRARITSADGSVQSVPIDPLGMVISRSVPITAIDLTRAAGTVPTVELFLGQIT